MDDYIALSDFLDPRSIVEKMNDSQISGFAAPAATQGEPKPCYQNYVCITCNTCQRCVTCQTCNVCNSCNSCQGCQGSVCNANCNTCNTCNDKCQQCQGAAESVWRPEGCGPLNHTWEFRFEDGYTDYIMTASQWNDLRDKAENMKALNGIYRSATPAVSRGYFTHQMYNELYYVIYGGVKNKQTNDYIYGEDLDYLTTGYNAQNINTGVSTCTDTKQTTKLTCTGTNCPKCNFCQGCQNCTGCQSSNASEGCWQAGTLPCLCNNCQ